jgi:hypothetical protein
VFEAIKRLSCFRGEKHWYKTKKHPNKIRVFFTVFCFLNYRPFVHPAVQVGTPDPFPAPVAVVDSV